MITTIFFDVDGTLYDETDAKIKAELQTAEYISAKTGTGFDDTYNAYIESKWATINGDNKNPDRNNRIKWYQTMLDNLHITRLSAEALSTKYWEVVNENIRPYYDVTLILPQLAGKYKLYVITDELLEICEKKLNVLGLRDYFAGVISSTHVGAVKPHKELFDYAMKVATVTAEESIMVGDHPERDILGGNNAGMKTAWLRRGRYFYYSGEKPDIVIDNYINFPRQIEVV